ncbi:MAG: DUF411 domain-containing protein [Fluviibacter phosphoraccumulans]
MKTSKLTALVFFGLISISAYSETLPVVDVYETSSCPCCKDWDTHMRKNGFNVQVHIVDDPSKFREKLGMPHRYGSCHTAKIGRYTIEGHVPADDIKQLLKENPTAVGLSVPGMVQGSPGMEGPNPMPYDSLLVLSNGKSQIFKKH